MKKKIIEVVLLYFEKTKKQPKKNYGNRKRLVDYYYYYFNGYTDGERESESKPEVEGQVRRGRERKTVPEGFLGLENKSGFSKPNSDLHTTSQTSRLQYYSTIYLLTTYCHYYLLVF